MFLGTYTPRLDDKGRLVMPAKYREELESGVVVTRGQERCLYVFTREEFRRKTQGLHEAPISSRRNRGVMRMIGALAHDDRPDKQGRLSIPQPLREYAGLDREVAVVGALNKFEVWSLPAWEAYQAENEESFATWDEEVADLF